MGTQAQVHEVSKVTLHKAEGAFDGSDVVAYSLTEAEAMLKFWSWFVTSELGYDKVDFAVYLDGSDKPTYRGRFDLMKAHQTEVIDLKAKMLANLRFFANEPTFHADSPAEVEAMIPLVEALSVD